MPRGGKKGQNEPEKEKGFWVHALYFLRNPRAGLLALVAALIVAFATGVGSWISEKASHTTEATCVAFGWCYKAPDEPWKIAISTAVKHCLPGRLPHLMRDWNPSVKWQAGADRLVICGNAELSGQRSDIPNLLGEAFPDCLSVTATDQEVVLKTNLENPAVCRAPYRFEDGTPIKADLPSGLFVCIPGASRVEDPPTYTQDGMAVPVCSDEQLKHANFL